MPVILSSVRISAVLGALRSTGTAVSATIRQLSPTRVVLTALAAVILVAVVLFVPLPTAVQLRDWANSAGPWFPLAFLAAHIAITVLPFPRTPFTLAAGLLFGPALGVPIAVTASTCAAVIALLLVRAAGWQLNKLISHPRVDSLDERLRTRGWPTVLSLRLIPAVPFSVLNYAVAASAVRLGPYLLATVAGLLPGTAAVVILGDAMTGHVSPSLLLVSACTATAGIAGLVYEIGKYRRDGTDSLRGIPE